MIRLLTCFLCIKNPLYNSSSDRRSASEGPLKQRNEMKGSEQMRAAHEMIIVFRTKKIKKRILHVSFLAKKE